MGFRALLRRDRLTGQIAIAAVCVLCAGAVIFGVGIASAKFHLANIGGWLAADKKGEVVHVNGLTGQVDGKVKIDNSTDTNMQVVQDGNEVLIVDETTGVVSRVDPSQLSVEENYQGQPGLQIAEGSGVAYSLSAAQGTVQELDPSTLSSIGPVKTLQPPLDSGGVDGRATLWVPVPASGHAGKLPKGSQIQQVPVGEQGDLLGLTIAGGTPVIVDSTRAEAVIVGAGGQQKVRLPVSVESAGRGGLLTPPQTGGLIVPLLNEKSGSMVILDAANGTYKSVGALDLPPGALGQPQVLGSNVYIPNTSNGTLLVYNTATDSFQSPITVSGTKGPLDVFVQDGILWANDPDNTAAIDIDSTGKVHYIQKYQNNTPGSGIQPVPKVGNGKNGRGPGAGSSGPGGSHPAASPPPPTPPKKVPPRTPQSPPDPVTNIQATPENGSVTITFTPSPTNNAAYYKLVTNDPGTVAPAQISANASSFTFTVTGGTCSTAGYTFSVDTYWTNHGKPEKTPVHSTGSATAAPCTAPGQPTNVGMSAGRNGATFSWNAPSNTGSSAPPTYSVQWSGPDGTGGGPYTTSGNSYTAPADINGSYSVTVSAVNAVGTTPAQDSGSLIGQPVTYSAQSTGVTGSGDVSNLCSTPAVCSNAGGLTNNTSGGWSNGVSVPVSCQEQGPSYSHRGLTSDMYDHISYDGQSGYIIGYLITTPAGYNAYQGLPLWRCS